MNGALLSFDVLFKFTPGNICKHLARGKCLVLRFFSERGEATWALDNDFRPLSPLFAPNLQRRFTYTLPCVILFSIQSVWQTGLEFELTFKASLRFDARVLCMIGSNWARRDALRNRTTLSGCSWTQQGPGSTSTRRWQFTRQLKQGQMGISPVSFKPFMLLWLTREQLLHKNASNQDIIPSLWKDENSSPRNKIQSESQALIFLERPSQMRISVVLDFALGVPFPGWTGWSGIADSWCKEKKRRKRFPCNLPWSTEQYYVSPFLGNNREICEKNIGALHR